jgi:hypothetical protein
MAAEARNRARDTARRALRPGSGSGQRTGSPPLPRAEAITSDPQLFKVSLWGPHWVRALPETGYPLSRNVCKLLKRLARPRGVESLIPDP